jgi:guanylate kinase
MIRFGYSKTDGLFCFLYQHETSISIKTLSSYKNDGTTIHTYSADNKINKLFIDSFVPKKIILMGAGASGKDYFKNKLVDFGMKCDVSYTKRPMRDGEVDGVDYNFVSKEYFENMIVSKKFVQWNKFGNGHYYGTSKDEFEKCDVFIMTPSALEMITKDERKKSFVVYFCIDEETRKERLINRNDKNASIERRLNSDKNDFESFTDYDYIITNPNHTIL